MICPKCKTDNPAGAIYCNQCGRKLTVTKKRRVKSRGNGTGCAYYDPIHRYWVAQAVVDYRKPEDETKQMIPVKKTKSGFKTRDAALIYCQELKGKKQKVMNMTLQQLYDAWEPWYSPRVDKCTVSCYRAAFAYFKPLCEEIVRDISPGDLQKCMDDCPRGHRTHQNMKCISGLLWAYAIDHNLADKDVTKNLYIGKGSSVQREPLDDMEVEKIHQQIGKDRYAPYIYCLCYLGFRPGEMLEIRKTQVHEHNGSLYIVEGKKTDAGRDRIVPVHPKIETIIRQQLFIPGTDLLFPQYMFTMSSKKNPIPLFLGFKEMNDSYFNKFAFRPLADRIGIPKHKVPYSARHTFSDKLKNASGTDKVKAALMGHTDYQFTQKKYQSTNLDELMTVVGSIK